jgi:Lipoprotein amino terminal region
MLNDIYGRWDEGEIRQLEFESRDEYWSRNIKKGILTLLQVNLKGTNGASESQTESRHGSSVHHPVRPVIRSYSRLPRSDVNSVYKVVEVYNICCDLYCFSKELFPARFVLAFPYSAAAS